MPAHFKYDKQTKAAQLNSNQKSFSHLACAAGMQFSSDQRLCKFKN